MARKTVDQHESDVTRSVKDLIDNSDAQTALIKNRWRDNYDMFVYGSKNEDKEEWQTNFSVNKLQTSTRTAHGRLVSTLVNTPDWYELCPRGYGNQQAEILAKTFQKMMDYYLETSKFKRHAATFMLCSLISQGGLYVGWKQRLVQNPEYILKTTEKAREKEQKRIAKNVVNPQVSEDSLADYQQMLDRALDEFNAEAQGKNFKEVTPPQYLQIGSLDLLDINHEKIYWDPNVQYMEDSMWKAFKYTVNRYELDYFAKLGYFDPAKVEEVGDRNDLNAKQGTERLRYGNVIDNAKSRHDLVELTVYCGPLIVDGEIKKDKYFCVIANDKNLLKEGDYPFWEPPGHHTPIIASAVRQVPYRATGAGIGDNAVQLQRIYDSNWQLVCDTFRFGIAGINVVNYQNLVDKSQLAEGVYPGMTLEIRGTPKETFEHVSLTSNLENQASPVQSMLANAIDDLTGVNELMTGSGNQYSRTPAAETNARLDAGTQNINTVALDLETNFLIPVLQKIFARVLQFGMQELSSNPELQSLFDEEEMHELSQLTSLGRFEVLNQWYNFKIKGFSAQVDKNAAAQRDNELLQIINSGGPISSLINLPEVMKEYFRNRDYKDPERFLIVNNSPLQQVTSENETLMSGHQVIPSQNDDHEFHMQMHGPIAQSPYATPEMQQHFQMHQQALMMMQQMQAQQQEQGPVQ